MDIAKYAGLYFQRSEFLYLPGLGNLEIQKKSSIYNQNQGAIQAPENSIIFKPTLGVIDDSFANFVANNERISIAAASNGISDFTKAAKTELSNGNKVEIPGLGSFFQENGQINFEVSPHFVYTPKSIPVFQNVSNQDAYKQEDNIKEIIANTSFSTPTSEDEIELEKGKINYGKVVLLILLGLAVLGGLGYLIYYMTSGSDTKTPTEQTTQDLEPTPAPNNNQIDSNQTQNTTDTNLVDNSTQNAGKIAIIVNEYSTEAKAEARVKRLQSIPYEASFIQKDSIYLVVVQLPASEKGAQFVADSIKPILNPNYNVRPLE